MSTVKLEFQQAPFYTGMVGPRVAIFLSPLKPMDSIYLTYPYQPVGNIKTNSRTSIRDVIVMLKFHCNVFLKVFQYYMTEVFSGEQEKESIIRVRMG